MAELWLLVGVVVILGLGAWKGLRPVLARLDARADEIREALKRADDLRLEAEARLADIGFKSQEAEAQAEEIIRHAEAEAKRLAEVAKEKLAEDLARRKQLAEARLAQEEAELADELRARIADLAVSVSAELLDKNLTESDQRGLADKALEEMADKL